MCDYLAGMTDRYASEIQTDFWQHAQIRVTVSSAGKPREQLRNRFPLPRQNQLRRDFTQRLKHKPPQMRPRMRQNQFRRVAGFLAERNQIQIQRARLVQNSFWARGQIPFPVRRNFSSNDSGVSSARGTKPTTAFTNIGEPGGQSTGDVCQSEDLRIGSVGKILQPRHRVQNDLPRIAKI